jgi:hypothetical protein
MLMAARLERDLRESLPADQRARLEALKPEIEQAVAQNVQRGGHSPITTLALSAKIDRARIADGTDAAALIDAALARLAAPNVDIRSYSLAQIDLHRAEHAPGTNTRIGLDGLARQAAADPRWTYAYTSAAGASLLGEDMTSQKAGVMRTAYQMGVAMSGASTDPQVVQFGQKLQSDMRFTAFPA